MDLLVVFYLNVYLNQPDQHSVIEHVVQPNTISKTPTALSGINLMDSFPGTRDTKCHDSKTRNGNHSGIVNLYCDCCILLRWPFFCIFNVFSLYIKSEILCNTDNLKINKFDIKYCNLHTWIISENLVRKYWILKDDQVLKYCSLKNSAWIFLSEEHSWLDTPALVAKTITNTSYVVSIAFLGTLYICTYTYTYTYICNQNYW